MLASFEAVVRALNEAGVRYLVVGGLAVNAHGYVRMTQDLDLVIDLLPDNIERTLNALGGLGYRPALPVAMADFADEETRREWVEKRNMVVFQLWSERYPQMSVDIFATMPFDYEAEQKCAVTLDVAPGVPVPFASIEALLEMKRASDRPRDRDDIQHLRWLLEDEE